MSTKNVKAGLSKANVNAIAGAIGTATLNRLVPIFSTSVAYEKGQYTNYNNQLYRFTANKAAGAWDSSKVESASLNDLIHDVNQAVADVADKASVDGNYATLGAGHADSAASLDTEVGNDDETPFGSATVGIESDVETGLQELKKLVGVKVVKNQQFEVRHTLVTEANVTFTPDVDSNSIVINGTNNNSSDGYNYTNIITSTHGEIPVGYFKQGNIYAILGIEDIKRGTEDDGGYKPSIHIPSSGTNALTALYDNKIFTAEGTNSVATRFYVYHRTGQTFDNIKLKPRIINLTHRYGTNAVVNAIIGSDTSKQIERLFAFDQSILNDNDYDEGSFTSCKSAKLKTVDYNQWNETDMMLNEILTDAGDNHYTNNGYLTLGTFAKKIKIDSTKEYDVCLENDTISKYAAFYDEAGNVVQKRTYYGASAHIVPPLGAKYMLVSIIASNSTLSAYGNNVSLFIYWDGSRIGYEPHQEHIINLPNKDLNGILKVVDGNIVADGDEIYPNGEGNRRRYGVYTVTGSESWDIMPVNTGDTARANGKFTIHSIDSYLVGFDNTVDVLTYAIPNIRFNRFITTPNYKLLNQTDDNGENTASIYSNYLFFQSNAFKNKTNNEVKALLAGTVIIYPLKEDAELEADNFPENFYGDDFGTMQFLDSDGNPIEGLQGCEIFYKANVAGFAESLYVKASGDPDEFVTQDELEEVDNKFDPVLENIGGILRHQLEEKENIDFFDTAFKDMSEFNWQYVSYLGVNMMIAYDFVGASHNADEVVVLCPKYKATNDIWSSATVENLMIGTNYAGNMLAVYDSSYTDATAFKTAMKGILLAYKKASS